MTMSRQWHTCEIKSRSYIQISLSTVFYSKYRIQMLKGVKNITKKIN